MCDAHLFDGPLVCVRPGVEHGHSHVYESAWAPDRHDFERDEDS